MASAFLLVLLSCPALSRAQAIIENELVEPRAFGYVVGDKIRREMLLTLNTGYALDEASLPEAGRLDRWLEVAAPEVDAESMRAGIRYRIVLTYQIFNAPQTQATVTIPQQDVRIIANLADGRENAFTTLIPALRITVAPVTSAVLPGRLSEASLQDDRAPGPIRIDSRQTRLAWIGLALLLLLFYAAWRRGLMAFLSGRDLPFTTAVRKLKKLQAAAGATPSYAAGLRVVHDAINRTAGRAVFAHNVDEFLDAHPRYAGLRDEFRDLFAASGRVFFDGGEPIEASTGGWEALLRLCRQCSGIERRQAGSGTVRPSLGEAA